MQQKRCDPMMRPVYDPVFVFKRITKLLIEQDGPDWREKLPNIPLVPLSAQQHRHEEPPSAELAQARAARAAEEAGRCICQPPAPAGPLWHRNGSSVFACPPHHCEQQHIVRESSWQLCSGSAGVVSGFSFREISLSLKY